VQNTNPVKKKKLSLQAASGLLKRECSLCGMNCLNRANVGAGTTIGADIGVYLIDIAF
jgi:hypothetical protein